MALPGDWNTITLTGTFVDAAGTPLVGTITFNQGDVVKSPGSDMIVYPKTLSATLNGSGHFSIVLPRTNDPDIEPEFVYTVTETFTGMSPRTYQLQLGMELGGLTVDLADLAPLASGADVSLLSHAHSNPLYVGTMQVWFGPTIPSDAPDGSMWIH